MHRMLPFIVCAVATMTTANATHWRDLPPCIDGKWSDITATDANGNVIGSTDATDWGCLHGGAASHPLVADVGPAPPPTDFCLQPAAPNPAPSETRLVFTVPQASRVTLAIYGKKGNGPHNAFLVRTILDRNVAAGVYAVLWNLHDDRDQRVRPDLYRAVLVTDTGSICGDIAVQ